MSTDTLFNDVESWVSLGRYDKAFELCRKALPETRPDAEHLHLAARCALSVGELAQAEAWIGEALALAPDILRFWRLMADILMASERFSEAAACLQAALARRTDGGDAGTCLQLGGLLHYLGQHQAAVDVYLKALALAPEEGAVYDALSKVYNSMGRPEAAREWRESKPLPPTPDGLGALVSSEEVSGLSDAEYGTALDCLDRVEAMIESRQALPEGHVGRPSGQWSREDSHYFGLLATRDRDIIRKMRFYSQEFSGWPLPTVNPLARGLLVTKKIPDNYDEWMYLFAPNRSYAEYVATFMNSGPERLRIPSPPKFAEVGWRYLDGIMNLDTLASQIHIADMDARGLLDWLDTQGRTAGRPPLVMEIGGGFGALAYRLLKIVPTLRYVIVDLPESLAFSSIYLRTLFPGLPVEFVDVGQACRDLDKPGLTFVSNAAFAPGLFGDGGVDLALNTMSLGEMSDSQITCYGAGVASLLGPNGMFYEQNHSCLDGFDYVGRIMAPFYDDKTHCESLKIPFVFPGTGHIWRRPRKTEALARFTAMTARN